MMMYLYARRDDGSSTFYPPMIAPCDQSALRTYVSIYGCLDAGARFYRLGIFNNETGAVEGTDFVDLTESLSAWFKSYSNLVAAFQLEVDKIGGTADGSESD